MTLPQPILDLPSRLSPADAAALDGLFEGEPKHWPEAWRREAERDGRCQGTERYRYEVAAWLLAVCGMAVPESARGVLSSGIRGRLWMQSREVHPVERALISCGLDAPDNVRRLVAELGLPVWSGAAYQGQRPEFYRILRALLRDHFGERWQEGLVMMLEGGQQAPRRLNGLLIMLMTIHLQDIGPGWPESCDLTLVDRLGDLDVIHMEHWWLFEALPDARKRAVLALSKAAHPLFLIGLDTLAAVRDALERLRGFSPGDLSTASQKPLVTTALAVVMSSPPLAREVLQKLMTDASWLVQPVVRALRLVADETSMVLFLDLLGNKDDRVSWEAGRALASLGADRCLEPLKARFSMASGDFPAGSTRARFRMRAVEVLRMWLATEPGLVLEAARDLMGLSGVKGVLSEQLAVLREPEQPLPPLHIEEARLMRGLVEARRYLLALGPCPDAPVGDLAAAFEMFSRLPTGGRYHAVQREVWEPAIEVCKEHPAASVACVEAMWVSKVVARSAMKASLGAEAHAAIGHQLLYGIHPLNGDLYEMVRPLGEPWLFLHLAVMVHGSEAMRESATKRLAEMGDVAFEPIVERLGHGRAAVRRMAARCLFFMKDPRAIPALKTARGKEKSAGVRDMIQRALAACSPGEATAMVAASITYGPNREDALNGLLEQLRTLTHEAPNLAGWVRLCDLMARIDAMGSVALGVDYLRGGEHPVCRAAHSVLPWSWEKRGALSGLGQPAEVPWLPVSAFLDDEALRARFFKAHLPKGRERRLKGRLDPADATRLFGKTLFAGWRWCEEHGLPPESLSIQIDSGTAGFSSPATKVMSLRLWQGFGVQLSRETATRASGGGSRTLLVHVKARVPRRHALRDHPDHGKRIHKGSRDLTRIVSKLVGL